MADTLQTIRGVVDKPRAGLPDFIFFIKNPPGFYRVFPDTKLLGKAPGLFDITDQELILVGSFAHHEGEDVFYAVDARLAKDDAHHKTVDERWLQSTPKEITSCVRRELEKVRQAKAALEQLETFFERWLKAVENAQV